MGKIICGIALLVAFGGGFVAGDYYSRNKRIKSEYTITENVDGTYLKSNITGDSLSLRLIEGQIFLGDADYNFNAGKILLKNETRDSYNRQIDSLKFRLGSLEGKLDSISNNSLVNPDYRHNCGEKWMNLITKKKRMMVLN